MDVCTDRDEILQSADADIVQQNFMMQSAKQARAGNLRKAQSIMKAYERKTKSMQSESWAINRTTFCQQAAEVYGQINKIQKANSQMTDNHFK